MAKVFPEGTSLPENIGQEWAAETGAVPVYMYEGEASEVYSRYATEVAAAAAYPDPRLASIAYEPYNGRARLIKRFMRANETIEELYEVDVIKDVSTAPYFSDLTDKEVAAVRYAYDNPADPITSPTKWDGTIDAWSTLQQTLYKHYTHGAESYVEKAFDLRISKFISVATAAPVADLTNIGSVVGLPALSASMTRLVATLPAGEWLQGAMNLQHLGKGRWRSDNLLHWAKKWSVIYGGTLFAP
jgi:hypothetical protein